ncbi:MAG TPA: HEAT repeat domain-containing protein [Kofleriaceae bacterium]
MERWAAPGIKVVGVGVDVPGIELFGLDDGKPIPMDAYKAYPVVAVVGGLGNPILQGPDVMRAVIKATNDPKLLARAALVINGRAGQILDGATDDVQRKRGVTAPTLSASALDFWTLSGSPSRNLYHAHLDLSTTAFAFQASSAGDDEVIANAIAGLSTTKADYSLEIELLKQRCGNAAARKALFDALAHHKVEDVRYRVAQAVAACGTAAIDPLAHALEHDAASDVRSAAAIALGEIGDRTGKPALEKAAQDSDPDVSRFAKQALKKLK